MKKILASLLAICFLLLSCAPILTSCTLPTIEKLPSDDEDEEEYTRRRKTTEATEEITDHTHKWGKWTTVEEPYCGNAGVKRRVCKCGAEEEAAIPATAQHSFGAWKVISESTCSIEGQQSRICTKCQFEDFQPLPYEDHICTEVVIPATRDRDAYAISVCDHCDYSYESQMYAKDEKSIGLSIYLSNSDAMMIGGMGDCMDSDLRIPDEMEGFVVTGISSSAFAKDPNLQSVVFGKNVEIIGSSAFRDCAELKVVVIPHSVTEIQKYAFDGCEKLEHVIYMGSEAQWSQITVGVRNNELAEATIHFLNLTAEPVSDEKIVYAKSSFDNDGDANYDTFAFSPTLPVRFDSKDAIVIDAGNFTFDSNMISTFVVAEIPHYYINFYEEQDGADKMALNAEMFIAWEFSVPEDGYYDFCFRLRLKDSAQRGNIMLVDDQVYYQMDYRLEDDAIVEDMRDNPTLQNSYMSGFGVSLTAGEHILKMKGVPTLPKTFHFRNIYLVKTGKYQPNQSVPSIPDYPLFPEDVEKPDTDKDPIEPGDFPNSVKMPSQFDNNEDGIADTFTFSPAIPAQFTSEQAIKIDASKYTADSVGVTMHTVADIVHYYLDLYEETDKIDLNADMFISWEFEVPEDGYYDFCFQLRMKDGRQRGNIMLIDGVELYKMDFQFKNGAEITVMDDSRLMNSYMTGFGAELTAGKHILTMKGVPTISKAFHFRAIYLVKTGEFDTGYDPIVPF